MNHFNEAREAASLYIQAAIVARHVQRDKEEALRLSELAFEAEKQAAYFLLDQFENEPMRSIVFRSAASLALECKKYPEVLKLIYQGLAGNPPKDVTDDLMDLYERFWQETKGATMPSAASLTERSKAQAQTFFWLKGVLTFADARQHKITIVSDNNKPTKVNVPRELAEKAGSCWDKYVSAYILKQGKSLTLVEIDKIFMQKTA